MGGLRIQERQLVAESGQSKRCPQQGMGRLQTRGEIILLIHCKELVADSSDRSGLVATVSLPKVLDLPFPRLSW
jgi:hypothetical protein